MEKKDNLHNSQEENVDKDMAQTPKDVTDENKGKCDCMPQDSEDVVNDNQGECDSEQSNCKEIEELKAECEAKAKQCEEYFNMLQRTAAEFDNYKKRTAREKEALYQDATCDVVAAFLPVVDNLERAIQAANNDAGNNSLKEGIELVYRQFGDVLKKLNVEVIEAVGKEFDPNLHNAVSHVEDENYGENEVVEEFQKGYILKDKVIRHSMVKVAN
jgi:molecular chaperone GrpE